MRDRESSYPIACGRLRRRLAATLVAVAVAGCASSGVNRGDFNLVSVEDEWKLGNQLEADVAKQVTLVRDRTANAYINRLGKRLVAQTEMAGLPWEFHIVADPQVNAFNIPGGHVYVHTGLIAAAGDASELAGVMAHEIAHGVARHGTERLTKAYGLNVLAAVALGNDPGASQRILAQLVGGGALAKFSRDDERESDRLGVRMMSRAGWDPLGMARMFEELLGQRRRRPGSVERFFSSHPLTEERIADVKREAASLGAGAGRTRNDNGFADLKRRVARHNR